MPFLSADSDRLISLTHRHLGPVVSCMGVWATMFDRLKFEVVCPHTHAQTVAFTREEFETKLRAGGLLFHCNTCDTNWSPSREETARFRKEFDRAEK